MLPKCVLVAPKRRGRHHKPLPINHLCDLWSKGQFGFLWEHASQQVTSRTRQAHTSGSDHNIRLAIGLAKEGLYGKACQILTSSGVAPNNDTTWQLLQAKHPKGPPPVCPPNDTSNFPSILPNTFDILSVLRSFTKSTACGPSGLRVQHLLDATEVPMQSSICSSLRSIVNLLATSSVSNVVSKFLAGGNLTALTKDKPGSPPDIRPIAVGETLRRLVGKCLCQITKGKASDYFSPHQFGVACPSGAEKIVHGLRSCIEEHQNEQDFVVMKIDLRNAFNLVSRQALLDECSAHFPELLQWAAWCYGQHPLLWSPMGTIMSESGVQQGDPLGPLLFCLVLQKVLSAIASDPNCFDLLFHAWYIDDGVIAGSKQAIVQALSIIQDLGPPLGLVINSLKCELNGDCDLQPFPSEMKKCNAFNFEILGAPIGDTIFCAKFIAEKRAGASKFLALLKEVGSLDSQVALVLLRQCGGFCRFVHIARCTPPSLASEGLHFFDIDVRQCFSDCLSIDLPNTAWQQAQLCLSRGGLGLRSLSQHSAAAYVASSAVSGSATNTSHHLLQSIDCFNSLVSPADVTSTDELLTSPKNQKELSSRIEHSQFQALFESSSLPNRARLLSVASPHAASWLSVVPSPGLNLHLESAEFQTAIKWWLGIDLFSGEKCPCCLTLSLDPLGHRALTCRHNGDVVSRHNRVRDVFFESCRQAGIGGQMEVGSGLGHDARRTRPADVLVPNWVLGKPAAFDITVTSPLTPITLHEASVTSGSTAQVAENRKHASNDAKCSELGWVCVPLAVEAYGCWGPEAQTNLSRLAARLAIRSNCCKSQATLALYGRLNLVLVRANARALLSRSMATGC